MYFRHSQTSLKGKVSLLILAPFFGVVFREFQIFFLQNMLDLVDTAVKPELYKNILVFKLSLKSSQVSNVSPTCLYRLFSTVSA